jgi:hypothetical protein
MEVYKILNQWENWSTCILKITGNSRFRVLNDYEFGLIDKKYISYDKGVLYLKAVTLNDNVYNINETDNQKTTKKKMFYMKFICKPENIPCIAHVWDYNAFTPFNIIYPVCRPTKETCAEFGFPNTNGICEYEMSKNHRIMDKEYINDVIDKQIKKKKFSYPQIVSKYGTIIKLSNIHKNTTTHYTNINPTETTQKHPT